MSDMNLYKKYTLTQLLKLLSRQKVHYIKGDSILFPISKAQREIFKAFAIKPPVLL